MNVNSAPAKAPRKRKRSAESLSEDSEDGSKRRGRPRTEKPDESTADVSLITISSSVYFQQQTLPNMKADTTFSVGEHRSAWLKELTDRGRRLPWTSYESVSPISLLP
jgi:hypothetical protein